MTLKRFLVRMVLVAAVVLLAVPLRAQDTRRYTPLEVETVHHRHTDEPVLKNRFNNDRPYVISINEKIPDAQAIWDRVVQELGAKGWLDKLVFDRFGKTPPRTLEVAIGVNVPVEISQAVLRAVAGNRALPLIVSLKSEDEDLGHTQRIYVGGLVPSGKRPIPPAVLSALLQEHLTHEEFLRTVSTLE